MRCRGSGGGELVDDAPLCVMSSASCPPLVRRHALRAATTATAVRARCAAWAENRSPTKRPLLETDRCIVVAAGRCGVLPIVWCASHRAVCSPSCGVLRDSVSRIQRIVRARDTGSCVVRMVCAYLAGVEYFPRNLKPHCANAAGCPKKNPNCRPFPR